MLESHSLRNASTVLRTPYSVSDGLPSGASAEFPWRGSTALHFSLVAMTIHSAAVRGCMADLMDSTDTICNRGNITKVCNRGDVQ
jgi:hypothetical protein